MVSEQMLEVLADAVAFFNPADSLALQLIGVLTALVGITLLSNLLDFIRSYFR